MSQQVNSSKKKEKNWLSCSETCWENVERRNNTGKMDRRYPKTRQRV